jgi:hypothetical protein
VWVTSIALSTALDNAYVAEQVSLFAILMGTAMLLIGIGFAVLTIGVLREPSTRAVLPVRERAEQATTTV